jgi:hypothetical protein
MPRVPGVLKVPGVPKVLRVLDNSVNFDFYYINSYFVTLGTPYFRHSIL